LNRMSLWTLFNIFALLSKGWDKTYCLQHLKDFKEIHFFGDKTEPVRHIVQLGRE
jgi:hypothetical protein